MHPFAIKNFHMKDTLHMHTYCHDSNSNQQLACSAFWQINPTCCAHSRFSPQTASSAQKHQWQIAFWFATQALLCPQIPCLSASLAILIIVFEKCMGLSLSFVCASVFFPSLFDFVSFSLCCLARSCSSNCPFERKMTWDDGLCAVRQVSAPNKASQVL